MAEGPGPSGDGPHRLPPERRERIWAQVMSQIDLDAPGDRPLTPPPSRWPLPSRGALTAAALVLVVVLVGASALVRRAGEPPDQIVAGPGGAVAVGAVPSIEVLASRARAQDAVVLDGRAHRYAHWVVEKVLGPTGPGQGTTWRQEMWVDPDGRGRQRITPLHDPEHRIGEGDQILDEPDSLRPSGLTFDQLTALPAEPGALLDRLEQFLPFGRDQPTFAFVLADILSIPGIAPEVRAAAISALPAVGLDTDGWATDPHGRLGVALVGPGPATSRVEIVLDHSTGRPLSAAYSEPDAPPANRMTTIYRSADTRPGLTP